jgi:hypothetical protein
MGMTWEDVSMREAENVDLQGRSQKIMIKEFDNREDDNEVCLNRKK